MPVSPSSTAAAVVPPRLRVATARLVSTKTSPEVPHLANRAEQASTKTLKASHLAKPVRRARSRPQQAAKIVSRATQAAPSQTVGVHPAVHVERGNTSPAKANHPAPLAQKVNLRARLSRLNARIVELDTTRTPRPPPRVNRAALVGLPPRVKAYHAAIAPAGSTRIRRHLLRVSSALPACTTQIMNKLRAFRAQQASFSRQREPRRAAGLAPADISALVVPHMALERFVEREVTAQPAPQCEKLSAPNKGHLLGLIQRSSAEHRLALPGVHVQTVRPSRIWSGTDRLPAAQTRSMPLT